MSTDNKPTETRVFVYFVDYRVVVRVTVRFSFLTCFYIRAPWSFARTLLYSSSPEKLSFQFIKLCSPEAGEHFVNNE